MLAVALAACSSVTHSTVPSTSTTTAPARTTAPAPAPFPRVAALALARRLLGRPELPPGARRTRTSLPAMLRGPWQEPAGGNLVHVNRAWTVPGDVDAVVAFLRAHLPAGLAGNGVGTSSSRTETVRYVIETLPHRPANIAAAGVEIGVEARGADTLVNVVGGAQWVPRRPSAEYAGHDRGVVVSVVRTFGRGARVIRRVAVRGAAATEIARAFDALAVAPPGLVFGCTALSNRAVSYRVAFATSPAAAPDVVATLPPCGSVGVSVHGRVALGLEPSAAFSRAVARALGRSRLDFVS